VFRWYALALALQVVGAVVTGVEVWQGFRLWHDHYGPGRTATGTASGTIRWESSSYGRVSLPPLPADASTEQIEQLTDLEGQVGRELTGVVRLIDADRKVSRKYANEVAAEAENRVRPQIDRVVQYLIGQGQRSRWMPWWLGPALLLAGTIIGGVTDMVGAWPSPEAPD
jgi:hypothetical protein